MLRTGDGLELARASCSISSVCERARRAPNRDFVFRIPFATRDPARSPRVMLDSVCLREPQRSQHNRPRSLYVRPATG